jgi:hypothetical protein
MRYLWGMGLLLLTTWGAGWASLAAEAPPPPPKVTLDVKDNNLGDVLMLLHWQTGVSFAAQLPTEAEPTVSLTVKEVPLPEVLDLLVKQVGYQWRQVGGMYAVGPPPQPVAMPSMAEEEAYLMFPYRARFDASQLLGSLTGTQWDALSTFNLLTWTDLTPDQRDLLSGLYTALGSYWVKLTQVDPESLPVALRGAKLPSADKLTFDVRTWNWALE